MLIYVDNTIDSGDGPVLDLGDHIALVVPMHMTVTGCVAIRQRQILVYRCDQGSYHHGGELGCGSRWTAQPRIEDQSSWRLK